LKQGTDSDGDVHPTDATGSVVTQVQPITVIFPLPSADIPEVQQVLAHSEVQIAAHTADDKTKAGPRARGWSNESWRKLASYAAQLVTFASASEYGGDVKRWP